MSSCLYSKLSYPRTHPLVPWSSLWDGNFSRGFAQFSHSALRSTSNHCAQIPPEMFLSWIQHVWTLNSYIWFLITSVFIKCILKIEILSNWNASEHFKGRKAQGHIASFVHWCLSTTGNTVRVLSLLFQTILLMTVEKWKKVGKISPARVLSKSLTTMFFVNILQLC